MTDELRRRGFCANHKRIERLMAEHGIVPGTAGAARSARPSPSDAPPLPDLVERGLRPGRTRRGLCGDITYIPTGEGWLYLADVLDLGSSPAPRLGHGRPHAQRAGRRGPRHGRRPRGGDVDGVMFHHDRGAQYWPGSSGQLCDDTASPSPPGGWPLLDNSWPSRSGRA